MNLEKVVALVRSSRILRIAVLAAVITGFAVLAVYVRALPWGLWSKYGVYIDAFDSWIEYWSAEYLYKHGLGSWFDLKPPNPAVMKFWYPWGRDFTRTSYPFVPMLIASTYSIVAGMLTFQQWAALIPPLAGGLLVVALTLLVYRRFGLIPAVFAALLAALLPAASDRTTLGFIEKEGIVLPFIILSILFYSMSIEVFDRNTWLALVYSFVAGLMASIVGLGWGGYLLVVGVAAVTPLLLPAAGVRVERRHVLLPLAFYIGFVPAMLFSRFRGVEAFVKLPGGILIASMLLTLALSILYEKVASIRTYRGPIALLRRILESRLVYLIVFVVVLAVAFPLAYALGLVTGRAFYLLVPPGLREPIIHALGPLVESIAEHKAPDPTEIINEVGVVPVVFALAGLFYMLYRVVHGGDAAMIPVMVASGVGYYAMLNAAYFIQTGGVFTALAAAASLALPLEFLEARVGRRVVLRKEAVVAVVAIGALITANIASMWLLPRGTAPPLAYVYSHKLPMILTSAVTLFNYAPAWLDFLNYVKTHTSNNTVVVAWWDYGYWISVVGDRPSIADGATFNATQISVLARILVGDYREASKLLRELHCEPNRTIIVAYAVYRLSIRGNSVYAELVPGFADYVKSYWMIRIGGLDTNNYLANVGGAVLPWPDKPGVQNGILYRILFQAPVMLSEKGVVKLGDRRLIEQVSGKHVTVGFMGRLLMGSELKLLDVPEGFKPYAVAAYPIGGSGNEVLAVIVASYMWTGTTVS